MIRLTDYQITSSDAHNVATIGICEGDGTIHLAFDHHAHDLNYRVSQQGVATNPKNVNWSASLFGPVTDQLGSVGKLTRFTYPRFFNAPNGNLMLYYRSAGSGNGQGNIQEYDATTHDWTTGLGKFIGSTGTYSGAVTASSTSRNPYLNGIFYAGDRIHVNWGWRETTSSSSNHDISYAYSDDNGRTWYNNAGNKIGDTRTNLITVNSPGVLVANIPQGQGLSNQYTSYPYEDGRLHVIVVRNGSYEHHWRTSNGAWDFEVLPFSGSRPDLAGDTDGNLFLVHASGSRLKIAKGTKKNDGTGWTWNIIYTRTDATEMGEGIYDRGRWETDRILSVFGQEQPAQQLDYGSGTMIDGMPAPVHVLDIHVSSSAVQPRPQSGAAFVLTGTKLQWTAGQGASTHHVYLGTSREAVEAAGSDSPEFMGEVSINEFTPEPLEQGTTYFWRIDEVQSGGGVIKGAVWTFRTEGGTSHGSWAGYPIANEAMDVDTQGFLGWINVFNGDYVWNYGISGYLYCPEVHVTEEGSWLYFVN